MVVRYTIVFLFAMLPFIQAGWAGDQLYRCADGTFTNRAERECLPYDSTGIVRVQLRADDASKSTVKTDEGKQSFAEVHFDNEPAKK
jgi:hypothetical protein